MTHTVRRTAFEDTPSARTKAARLRRPKVKRARNKNRWLAAMRQLDHATVSLADLTEMWPRVPDVSRSTAGYRARHRVHCLWV